MFVHRDGGVGEPRPALELGHGIYVIELTDADTSASQLLVTATHEFAHPVHMIYSPARRF